MGFLIFGIVSLNYNAKQKLKQDSYHIIGVMSGTSLDGIDLAEIDFSFSESKWDFKILSAETIPYSSFWKEELREAVHYSEESLERLNFKYTELLAEVILTFIKNNRISRLDAVCSHGHTILHQPEKGLTLQIGNLPKLAKLIQKTVVCDFRVQDVALGGQGAPLVPIGDRLLFPEYDYCLNLGGFANISSEIDGERIAFDICPANIVLNHYAEKLGFNFDNGGKIAASGNLNVALLNQLNTLDFYAEKPPKSLGLEWVQQNIFPLLKISNLSPQDILRTFIEHIAMQLAAQLMKDTTVLVTGGGAYNVFLMERLKTLSAVEVVIPADEIVEYKEAIIFGLLGVLKLREVVNCLASVTGAKRDHTSGKIYN